MSQIDWSKAPEGFPLWITPMPGYEKWPAGWQKDEDSVFIDQNGGKWHKSCEGSMYEVHRRPTWTGEGPPPAGTVCELRNVAPETEWSQATIAFASRNVIVWDWVDEPAINGLCTAYAHAVQLRPIRTPEQLAAEARESGARQIAIDAMGDPSGEPPESQMIVARRLYDKGYRIFEIVDEESGK